MITKKISKIYNIKKQSIRKYNHVKKNKFPSYLININFTSKQIELLLLYSTIINHLLLLLKNKIPYDMIEYIMISLFKDIRKHNKFISKNTTDNELNIIFTNLLKQSKLFKKKLDYDMKILENMKIGMKTGMDMDMNMNMTSTRNQSGGFYFKSLEEKGEQPLTGNDLATLLDEIQGFFYNAQYTTEGAFLRDTNAVISMLRGDLSQFKGLLQWVIFPKYYQVLPYPFIKWNESRPGAKDGIKYALQSQKYEDIPDYLLAYQSYLRSRDEYLVKKGLKSPSVLGRDRYTGFYDKLAHSLDTNILKFQQYRRKAQGNFVPLSLPV